MGVLLQGGRTDLVPDVFGYENNSKTDTGFQDACVQEKNRNLFHKASSRMVQDNPAFDAVQAFQSVLLNREAFVCTDKMPYQRSSMTHEYNSCLNEMSIDNIPLVITEFAAVDLDGDDILEIVLAVEDYYGFIVLRYKEGQVHGNILGYRTMHSLKKDGSFRSSGGASDYSAGRMYFIGDTVVMDQRLYFFHPSYYKHDLPVSKNTFEKEFHSFDRTADVEWHPYSGSSVMHWFSELALETPFPIADAVDGRQDYLDSLSGLIGLTGDYTEKNRDERNADAEKYYKMCRKELRAAYKRCRKALSGSRKKRFKEDQKRWETGLKQMMSEDLKNRHVKSIRELKDKTLYFTYGDIVFRRILRLSNVLYDCRFYD